MAHYRNRSNEVKEANKIIEKPEIVNTEPQQVEKKITQSTTNSEDTLQKNEDKNSEKYHIIKKGDTLYAIAKKYGTTISNLCKINNIKENSILQIGQKVRYK